MSQKQSSKELTSQSLLETGQALEEVLELDETSVEASNSLESHLVNEAKMGRQAEKEVIKEAIPISKTDTMATTTTTNTSTTTMTTTPTTTTSVRPREMEEEEELGE